ncbi:MAG: hypothetical protein AB7F35_00560 [Acetobacteraceae bacterium]
MGGLGWSPSEFWNASVYDIERAIARAEASSQEQAKPGGGKPLSPAERDEILRMNKQMLKEQEQERRVQT